MITTNFFLRTGRAYKKIKILTFVCLLAGVGASRAQNLVLNGDFTANAAGFTAWPGYVGFNSINPSAITDWGNSVGGCGLNGSATAATVFGPTTQNGYSAFAFIQGYVGALTQNLPTLAVNTTYVLSFDVAGRGGNNESGELFRVQIGDATQVYVSTQVAGDDVLVADPAQFHTLTYTFTTPASFNGVPSVQLYNIGNTNDPAQSGDTVNFANVSVVAQGLPSVTLAETNTIYVGNGNSVTLSGSVVGEPSPTVQWFCNGSIIPGATNLVLSLANVYTAQAGQYSLVASNAFGSATNTVAVSILTTPPPNLVLNGNFAANAAAFTVWPDYLRGGNPLAITDWTTTDPQSGVNGTLTAATVFGPTTQNGYNAYAFIQHYVQSLTQNLSDLAVNTTYFLSFDVAGRSGNNEWGELFRVQIGDATQTYVSTQVGGADVLVADIAAFHTLTYTFTTPASFDGVPSIQLYNIGNTNDPAQSGDTVNFANVLLEAQGLPSVTFAQTNLTIYAGNSAALTGAVLGYPSPTAQWFYNGSIILGATNSVLSITNIQIAQTGDYSLVASNAYGSVTNAVVLTVLPPPVLALVGHWSFSQQTLANSGASGSTNDGAYFEAEASSTPVFSTDTPFGSGYSLDLTAGAAYMRVSNSSSSDASYTGDFDTHAPTFTVALWEKTPTAGSFGLPWWNVFADKVNGSESIGFYLREEGTGENGCADLLPYPHEASGSENINDGNWHHLCMTFDGATLSYYVDGALAGTASGPYLPDPADSLLFGSKNQAGDASVKALFNDVRFYNYALTTAQVSVLSLAPGLPSVSNPNRLELYQGLNAPFSAVALGNPSPSVQWYLNGNLIAGATNQTLSITNVGIAQQGAYTIVASNSFGSVTSSPATLTAINPPANGTYAGALLAQNPMGYWRFSDGGGTNAYDWAGGNNGYDTNYLNNGNGGTGNPATLGAGPRPASFPGFEANNSAPLLDGLSQGYASSAGLFNYRSNFTLMGWFNINPSQYPIPTDPFTNPDGRASLFGEEWAAELAIYEGTNLYFFSTGISATIFANTNLVPGVWNFVAAVSDTAAGATTLYLNGVAVGTASACPGTSQPYLFSIGKNVSYPPSGGYDNAFFPGSLDEVAAFDHALPASTIKSLYNAALGIVSVNQSPTNLTVSVSSGQISLAWPQDHTGWVLEAQTNAISAGLGTNWVRFASSAMTNQVSLPVNPANPEVFYRLVYP
jgi:hypothetical protein